LEIIEINERSHNTHEEWSDIMECTGTQMGWQAKKIPLPSKLKHCSFQYAAIDNTTLDGGYIGHVMRLTN
jgi:hypothetical protein